MSRCPWCGSLLDAEGICPVLRREQEWALQLLETNVWEPTVNNPHMNSSEVK